MASRSLRLALVLSILLSAAPAQDAAPAVRYVVRPQVGPERVRLVVTMTARGSKAGRTTLLLPRDRYGTARLHEFVHDVGASAGAELRPTDDPSSRILVHTPGAEFTVRYTIDFDPELRKGAAYRPSVGRDHFHFLGPQWQMRIDGEEKLERDFHLAFEDVPRDWVVFSSFGAGPGPHRLHASWRTLTTTVLGGGGSYRHDTFTLEGRPVHTYVGAGFKVGDEVLARSIREVVVHQRDFFADHDHDVLVVTLTPRARISAGTSITNAFICYTNPENELARILRLVAHEMFHQWLPGRGRLETDGYAARYNWFDEGFTEYFARRLIRDRGILTGEAYVALFNEDMKELDRNEHNALTNEELRVVREEGRFTNRHFRLSYLRGALVALDWNARIVAASGGRRSLDDTMRSFMEAARAAGGTLPVSKLHALLAADGIDAAADIERWIEKAEPIRPASGAFGPGHVFEPAPADSEGAPGRWVRVTDRR